MIKKKTIMQNKVAIMSYKVKIQKKKVAIGRYKSTMQGKKSHRKTKSHIVRNKVTL